MWTDVTVALGLKMKLVALFELESVEVFKAYHLASELVVWLESYSKEVPGAVELLGAPAGG